MQKRDGARSSQKNDFEDIATILGVRKDKRKPFVTEAIRLADFKAEYDDFDRYLPNLRLAASPNPIIQANQDLRKVIECLREHSFALSRAASIDFRHTLAQIADHPNARALLPDLDFVSLEDIPRINNFLKDKPKSTGSAEGISDTYAVYPAGAFIDLLDLLQTSLATELKRCGVNPGGRPPKSWLRRHFIKELYLLHDKLFSNPAPPTPEGTFCTMCHLLFESFGESTDGLDEAIKRFLRQHRSETSWKQSWS